jgi:CubicO group peptidase (beta-lactamase class C family)
MSDSSLRKAHEPFFPLLNTFPPALSGQGLPTDLFPETTHLMTALVEEGVAPGGVLGVWTQQEPSVYYTTAVGHRRLQPSLQPMQVDTVFDIASVSKIFATATLAAQLVERGWIRWDSPLKRYLPDYPYSDIKLGDLLSHTAGLPAWAPLWQSLREKLGASEGDAIHRLPILQRQNEMRKQVLAIPREVGRGERVTYSDISFLLLGYALEEACGMRLDEAVKRMVWEPMGITGAYYRQIDQSVEEARNEQVAATENCPWRGGVIQGQVHDDNCWSMGGVAGHAGVFARAEDLLRFGVQWLTRYFSVETRRAAWSPVSTPVGATRTLGWDMPSGDMPSTGSIFSRASVGHLGFTGTSLWIDPRQGWVVTLLTNRVHLGRQNIQIREFRNRLHTTLGKELVALKK